MNTLEPNTASALRLHEKGYIPVPMTPGTKVPAVKGWNELTHGSLTREDIIAKWAEARYGIAILTRGLIVLDVDAEDKLGLVLGNCGLEGAPICRTPSGGYHVHARIRAGVERSRTIRLNGLPIDFLVGASLAIVPPTPGYEWLGIGLPSISELPLAKVAWTRNRVRKVVRPVEPVVEGERAQIIRRARAYIANIEGAVSGQGGHNQTFRVACVLIVKFGLSIDEAWPLFKEWNESCEPPWSDAELLHKLEDALKQRK